MPRGKISASSSSSSNQLEDEDTIFPLPILMDMCPQLESKTGLPTLSNVIENYLIDLVSHLIAMKEQSKIIRESIVAISTAAGSSASKTTVTTRDACRAIRSFTGQPIPDLTSITRVPQQQVVESTVSAQVTPVIAPVELGSLSPSMRAVSDEGMPEVTKKRSNSLLAAQASLKVPKKRGRPRKHPLPENR